ncbi:MAG: DUF6602 domain-containing protein [Candidatus Accumulibacter propinquus]
MRPNVSAYLESWGLELAARQNRVRHLIGDAHWLTDGHHKEAILRDFLSRHLPQECECSTGFVRSSNAEIRCSPEVDILLFSRRVHVPYFSEGGVSIIDPSSLLATIEVKSNFSKKPLADAINNVKITRRIAVGGMHSSPDLWSGIFFYDMPEGRTVESAVDTLGEEFKSQISPSDNKFLLPTCVVLGQNSVVFPSIKDDAIRIRAFDGNGLAFASAICDLLAAVTSQVGGLRLSGFEEWGASGAFRKFEKCFPMGA